MIKLKLILERIIAELGDFNNIKSYNYSNDQFITDEGWKVEVNFKPHDQKDLDQMKMKNFSPGEVYSVNYYIEGVETQFEKTNFKSLVKIIKTVVDIIFEFIKNNSQCKAIIVIGANRDKDKIFSQADPNKTDLYKTIIINQISKIGWKWKHTNIVGLDGFLIYK